MPRYLVERTFDGGLSLPISPAGQVTVQEIVEHNADLGVTWIHSYVSDDGSRTFCLYDGPSPEAIRKAANCNHLPLNKITKVTVLDPYFFLS